MTLYNSKQYSVVKPSVVVPSRLEHNVRFQPRDKHTSLFWPIVIWGPFGGHVKLTTVAIAVTYSSGVT
jgi:hypothetical protein